jgi:hypothetical protein
MSPEAVDLTEFFPTRQIGFGPCLEPTMQCGEPAIRAQPDPAAWSWEIAV